MNEINNAASLQIKKENLQEDEFGDLIEYSLPELKRCPVCRRECSVDEVEFLKDLVTANPAFDDKGYTN